MKDRLTVITTTHHTPSDRLHIKGIRPDTKTDLLEYVWEELTKKIDSDVRWIISLDYEKKDNPAVVEYKENIEKMIEEKYPNAELYLADGWRSNMIDAKNMVETPYFLFWEHDWVFTENATFNSLNYLLDIMDNTTLVNWIRFNKRENVPVLGDAKVWNPRQFGGQDFVNITNWSNNPHICRKSFWDDIPMEILSNEVVDPNHLCTENILTNNCTENWGCYLYGAQNHHSSVKHLNGNRWVKK